MNQIDLLLKILGELNASTPLITSLIGIIKGGAESGKTDEEIEAEAMKFALETKQIAGDDKGSQV